MERSGKLSVRAGNVYSRWGKKGTILGHHGAANDTHNVVVAALRRSKEGSVCCLLPPA